MREEREREKTREREKEIMQEKEQRPSREESVQSAEVHIGTSVFR